MGGSIVASSCLIILLIHLLLLMVGDARELGFSVTDEKMMMMSKEVELNDPIIKMKTQMDEVEKELDQEEEHKAAAAHYSSKKGRTFFTMNELKQGQKFPLYFPKRDPSKIPLFVTKEEADPIPFSLKEVPQILSYFSFSPSSPQAQAIKETLQSCELQPKKGMTRLCVTSKESMLDFLATSFAFASHSHFEALATSHLTNSTVHFQNYTLIEAPEEVSAPRFVLCHTMPYPYAVYYCHYQLGDTSVLKIPLRGDNGDLVDALAICHMDTSNWSPSNAAFRALNIQPGTTPPVCHFFPADDLVWMPLPA